MILIIGAGIAGLSLGWELTKAGAPVTITEAGKIASGASGVATSYLEPRLGQTKMRELEHAALSHWGDWALDLQDRSGIDVEFRNEGQIRVCLSENQKKFDKDILRIREQGRPVVALDASAVHEREPGLSRDLVAGAFLSDVRWVNGKRICEALAQSITDAGGTVTCSWAARGVSFDAQGVKVASQDGEVLKGDTVVIANGMGANNLEGLPDDIPKCRAVRGVNLIVDMSRLANPIRHIIKHHRGTLCPRSGNQLIVGTTYEPDITELAVGKDVIDELYRNAEDVLPNVRELPLLDVKSGLRTKIGDGKLRLGRSKQRPEMAFSLSHAGAGFLRAPVVAKEFAAYLLSGLRDGYTTPFID